MRRTFLFATALLAAAASVASADPLATASISTVATGTIGPTAFANSLVTITETFDYSQLYTCPDCSPGNYMLDSLSNQIDTTVTVAGIGTYAGDDQDTFSVQYGVVSLGDLQGHLAFDGPYTGFSLGSNPVIGGPITDAMYLGDSCSGTLPLSYCPIYFSTTDGELILTSVGDTTTTDLTVTPEPSTLTLLGTGLLSGGALMRRRLRS